MIERWPTEKEIESTLTLYEEDRRRGKADRRVAVLEAGRKRKLKPYFVTLWILGVLTAVVLVVWFSVWMGGNL